MLMRLCACIKSFLHEHFSCTLSFYFIIIWTPVIRYRSLQEPMQIRRENLEDALLLQQLIRDVDDEMQWLAEKEPQAASHDLGTSLTAVQSLQKKHQVH